MKYSIKGKNIQVTEAMEEYISSRVDSLDKYFIIDEETTAKILVRVYNSDQKIEMTIPTKFAILRAEARDRDLYTAVDKVVEKLEGQLRKQKTKLKNHKSKEKLGHALNMDFIQTLELDEMSEVEEGVVKTKHITPEAKDIDTAILEMEMLNHSFYIFRDIDTEEVAVLYKRKDGGYGLIETD